MIHKKCNESLMVRPRVRARARATTLSVVLGLRLRCLILISVVAVMNPGQVALAEPVTTNQRANQVVVANIQNPPQAELPPPSNLPKSYRYIGGYRLVSKTQVEHGKSMPVVIAPMVFRVYSDGIVVRIYCDSAGDESFTAYKIYRSDGVGSIQAGGELDIEAGVQAICKTGDMLRQISITRSSMTMVKMPPRSYRVVVTHTMALTNETPRAELPAGAPAKADNLATPQSQ